MYQVLGIPGPTCVQIHLTSGRDAAAMALQYASYLEQAAARRNGGGGQQRRCPLEDADANRKVQQRGPWRSEAPPDVTDGVGDGSTSVVAR